MGHALAIGFHAEHVGIFLREPRRRGSRRRAEDRNNVMPGGQIDGALQPVKVIVAFGGLHAAPGKLGDADDLQIGGFHQAQIFFPARFGPLFRIPRDTH